MRITTSPRLTRTRSRRDSPLPKLDLPGPHLRWRTRAIGFGLLAETLVIAGVAVSAYLVSQALSGATVADLWPWIIALTIVVPAIAACQHLDVYYPSHHVPDRLVAAAIPSLAAAGLYVIHPLLGLALGPFFLLSWSVPRWLRTRAGAQGHEIRFEKGATGALIGLGLIVVVCVSALLVSRGELSARGYLAAVVLTTAAFLRASCTDTIMDERMLSSPEAAPAREVLSP
jgi:hypothetical protein